jgi:hypothetical protein
MVRRNMGEAQSALMRAVLAPRRAFELDLLWFPAQRHHLARTRGQRTAEVPYSIATCACIDVRACPSRGARITGEITIGDARALAPTLPLSPAPPENASTERAHRMSNR